ncbi:Hypothetical predicted protein, partial [Pelobates cultripes]
ASPADIGSINPPTEFRIRDSKQRQGTCRKGQPRVGASDQEHTTETATSIKRAQPKLRHFTTTQQSI